MKIKIITFTEKGAELAARAKAALGGHETELCLRGKARGVSARDPAVSGQGAGVQEAAAGANGGAAPEVPLDELCREAFEQGTALLFISAMGIAVRSVAPFVKDKLTDPPVIVMDELGLHVIPVLSGHMGGANSLALEIAEATGADPVITTATEINEAFSVDLFAKENGLRIVNRDGIAKVSASALKGKPVTISIKDYPPQEAVDVLIADALDAMDKAGADEGAQAESPAAENLATIRLCPGRYAVGMGCRKGKSSEEIREFAERVLAENGVDAAEVGAIATIDIKAEEPGIKALAEYWKVPLITYEATLLEKVQGDFASSEFVKKTVGVDSVAERSAVLAAGSGSKLIVRKQAENGMTIAVAEKR